MTPSIHMSASINAEILRHLFPKDDRREQGGFLFCRYQEEEQVFEVLEWAPMSGSDYVAQERDYLELSDESRAKLIKKAHDMEAALVEIHCHPGQHNVGFSKADWHGFREFVPHIRWRLKGRPYAALVFGYQCVDGFAWLGIQKTPVAVSGIRTEAELYLTTGHSINAFNRGIYGQV